MECVTKEARKSLSSPLPKVLGEWALQAVFFQQYNYKRELIECTSRLTPLITISQDQVMVLLLWFRHYTSLKYNCLDIVLHGNIFVLMLFLWYID